MKRETQAKTTDDILATYRPLIITRYTAVSTHGDHLLIALGHTPETSTRTTGRYDDTSIPGGRLASHGGGGWRVQHDAPGSNFNLFA